MMAATSFFLFRSARWISVSDDGRRVPATTPPSAETVTKSLVWMISYRTRLGVTIRPSGTRTLMFPQGANEVTKAFEKPALFDDFGLDSRVRLFCHFRLPPAIIAARMSQRSI